MDVRVACKLSSAASLITRPSPIRRKICHACRPLASIGSDRVEDSETHFATRHSIWIRRHAADMSINATPAHRRLTYDPYCLLGSYTWREMS